MLKVIKNVVHNMKMTDKLVFRLLKIYRGFYDKTALNFILYTIHSFYIGKMCISVFYFMFLPLDDCQKIKLQIIMSSVLNLKFVFLVDNSYQVYENSDYSHYIGLFALKHEASRPSFSDCRYLLLVPQMDNWIN